MPAGYPKGMVMKMDLQEFAGACSCGRPHPIAVEEILLEAGAIRRLPGLMHRKGFKNPTVICDENTYAAAGEAVLELLPESELVVLDPENVHANERAVDTV